ncbi:protein of unknown function [Georgfuchsia toluolica]|uniref:Uncharacterized protein n=1 Tax=Georgfuchsia toluolica TaxID=424218 RepID=A0A916J7E3_9PROT|nr:hypothetical protein [Georgfuchsia toluolica]CAG4884550.1 protein of unknown function [Georgfuchsia toluolica]
MSAPQSKTIVTDMVSETREANDASFDVLIACAFNYDAHTTDSSKLSRITASKWTPRIADTFTDSLVRLTGEEQKQVKTTAFDLQLNPANPGHHFHKLDKAKDKSFWSRNRRRTVFCRTSSVFLCAPRGSFRVPRPRSRWLAYLARFSMSISRRRAVMCRSASCRWPRGWSSVPWS